MIQRSPVIQWLCLSALLCFLSSAISSAAQKANKTPSPFQPNITQGFPPQSQEKIPDQSDSKGGEAAAVASAAKLAVDMNNETVKRIEAFYANTVHDFETHFSMGVAVVTLVLAVMGAIGAASVFIVAKRVAKRQANKALEPIRKWHSQLAEQSTQLADQSRQIFSDHETIRREYSALSTALQHERQEYDALRRDFKGFQEQAVGNVRGLLTITLAQSQIMNYMQNISKVSDDEKSKFDSLLQEARRFVNKVINEYTPTDELILSLAYSVYGIILYFDNEFANALDFFRKSFDKDKENASAAFNRACCACKLADELDKRGAEKTGVVTLEMEALSSLLETLQLQPWRKAEVRSEGATGDLQRIREHPQFILLTS